MPRGYRCIVVAALGWLALTGAHPKPAASPEQTYADSRVGNALSNIAATYDEQAKRSERAPESPPCGPRQYQSRDDLCAQWKAADAAADSAWWAAFAGWFGGLSFFGVLAAIGLAFHSNWIARDTARRQLRAYINVEKVEGGDPCADGSVTMIEVTFKNTGQTPAKNMMCEMILAVGPIDFELPRLEAGRDAPSNGVVGAGCPAHAKSEFPDVGHEDKLKLANGEYAIIVTGIASYDDIFNERHETRFRYVRSDAKFGHRDYQCRDDGNDFD